MIGIQASPCKNQHFCANLHAVSQMFLADTKKNKIQVLKDGLALNYKSYFCYEPKIGSPSRRLDQLLGLGSQPS